MFFRKELERRKIVHGNVYTKKRRTETDIKTTNRPDVTVPGLAAADAVQLNALVQGTVAYTAAQAGSTEKISFAAAHEGISWYDTCFARAGAHICMAAVNMHIPNSASAKPQSGMEYTLCTLQGIRPAQNVSVKPIAMLSDNTTEIDAELSVKTTGEVAVSGRFSGTGLHIAYIRCSFSFLTEGGNSR